MTTDRVKWVDIAKGICMTVVVFAHAQGIYSKDTTGGFLYHPFYTSTFFFVSGYLLYFSRDRKLSIKLKTIFKSLIVPYFIFCNIVYFPEKIAKGEIVSISCWFTDIWGGVFLVVYSLFNCCSNIICLDTHCV